MAHFRRRFRVFLLVAMITGALAQVGETWPPLTCSLDLYNLTAPEIRVDTHWNAGCQFCGPVDFWYNYGDGTSGGPYTQDAGSGTFSHRHTFPSAFQTYTVTVNGESETTLETCSAQQDIFVF